MWFLIRLHIHCLKEEKKPQQKIIKMLQKFKSLFICNEKKGAHCGWPTHETDFLFSTSNAKQKIKQKKRKKRKGKRERDNNRIIELKKSTCFRVDTINGCNCTDNRTNTRMVWMLSCLEPNEFISFGRFSLFYHFKAVFNRLESKYLLPIHLIAFSYLSAANWLTIS